MRTRTSALTLAVPLALACPARPVSPPPEPPPGHLAFQSYGAPQGLADVADTVITQDADGYLWVATQSGGVFRYDGTSFVGFGREEGLPSANVLSLAAAADGGVWVGTFDGLAHSDGRRFVTMTASEGAPSGPINAIALGRERRVWVGAVSGLFRRDGDRFANAGSREVTALFADTDGTLFVAEGASLRTVPEQGPARSWTAEQGLGEGRITSVARDGAGRLWARSQDALHVLGADGRFVDRSCLLPARTHDGAMSVDRRGRLFVPSSAGLLVVDGDQAEVVDRARGLPSAFASHAFEDREGSLWIASVGVHKLLGRGVWSGYGEAEGLPNAIVWAIARAPSGALYVGTDSGLARGTSRGFELVPGTGDRTFGAIAFGPDGALYSTGSSAGLTRVDPRTSAMTSLAAESGLVTSDITLQLAIAESNEIWVTTRRDGLFRGDLSAGAPHFTAFPLPSGSPKERINHVLAAPGGRTWFAGSDGLAMLRGGDVRRFTTKDGLLDDKIAAIAALANGETCVTYRGRGGVTCFRTGDGGLEALRHVEVHQERRAVLFVGEDAARRLWAGGTRGVSVTGDRGFEPFGAASGMPGDDCAELAFLAEPGGDVWVGTSTGLGRFRGSAYRGPPAPPDAVLVEAAIGDRRAMPSPTGEQVVPPSEASLRIRFSALSFVDEKRVTYETRLSGGGEEFRPTTIPQEQYPSLSPGTYRFEARARLDGGPPGRTAQLSLRVLPAWWQTLWARLLAAGLSVGLVALGVRWRLRAALMRNVELERLVEERTQELGRAHQKVAEAEKLAGLGRVLAQLSHELNNPTNVIWNNLEPIREHVADLTKALVATKAMASGSPEGRARVDELWAELDLDFVTGDIGDALDIIRSAAQRVKSVHADLRAFMRGGGAALEVGDVVPVVRETVAMMRRGLPPGVTLDERYDTPAPFPFHSGQISQVVHNLLQNAVDAVGTKGHIVVEVGDQGDTIEISVSDDGPGISPELRTRVFEPFFTTKDVGRGTGLGLSICRQIVVENHHGTLEVVASVDRGATLRVRLPRVALR